MTALHPEVHVGHLVGLPVVVAVGVAVEIKMKGRNADFIG
jgi:hypothetical protein